MKPSQELADIVGSLGGVWRGYVATCRCPAHADRTPSLSLRQGDRGILVTCFAGCEPEDILRELRRIRLTGCHQPPKSDVSRRIGNVDRLWAEAQDVLGTPAERYLRGRSLEPGWADLRYHPRCPLGPKPKTIFRPALLVGVREMRRLVALQRNFLDAAGRCDRKVMLGQPGQGAWQGRPLAADTLAIAEGFETAAAFSTLTGIPCWATLGARRLNQLRLPTPITTLLIAQDNDAEGEAAAARAEAHYARPGLLILRAAPPRTVKDWALVLEARGRGGVLGG